MQVPPLLVHVAPAMQNPPLQSLLEQSWLVVHIWPRPQFGLQVV